VSRSYSQEVTFGYPRPSASG